jgi:hypothetical protein
MELTLRRSDLKYKLQIPEHPPIADMATEMSCTYLPPTLAKEVKEIKHEITLIPTCNPVF